MSRTIRRILAASALTAVAALGIASHADAAARIKGGVDTHNAPISSSARI